MSPAAGRLERHRFALTLCAVLAVSALVRLLFLAADPPGDLQHHFVTDEGWWARNARQRALFGTWTLDEANSGVYATPIYSLLLWLVYEVAGVGLAQTRLVSAFSGILTCGLVYVCVRRSASERAGRWAGLLLAVAYFMVLYGRAAFVESLQVLWASASILLAVHSVRAPRWALPAGLCLAAAIFTKITAAPVALVVAGMYFFAWKGPREARSPAPPFGAVAIFALGGAIGVAVGGLGFVLPNYEAFVSELFGNANTAFATSDSFFERFLAFGHPTYVGREIALSNYFQQTPLFLGVALLLLGSRLLGGARRGPGLLELTCWLWFATAMAAVASQAYQPDRRFLLTLPPLVILVALAADSGGLTLPARDAEHRGIAWWRRGLAASALGALLAIYAQEWIAPAIDRWTADMAIGRKPGLGEMTVLLFVWIGAVAVGVAVVEVVWRTLPRRPLSLPARWILLPLLVVEIGRLGWAATNIRFSFRDASREVGAIAQALPPGRRILLGDTADTLALETDLFAFLIRRWDRQGIYANLDGWERYQPPLVFITRMPGRDIHWDAGFREGLVPVQDFPLWIDHSGRARLVGTLYRTPETRLAEEGREP